MLFGKKKKKLDLPELPPLPSPPGLGMPQVDLAPSAEESSIEMPELPAPPGFEHEDSTIELPDAPSPEVPEPQQQAFQQVAEQQEPGRSAVDGPGYQEPVLPAA